jgi:superoxide dismutase, Cu-Zn family
LRGRDFLNHRFCLYPSTETFFQNQTKTRIKTKKTKSKQIEEMTRAVAVFQTPSIQGTVYFTPLPSKPQMTEIRGRITGLPPGKHGFHIHEYGDLTEGCASACAHWNPYGAPHGDPNEPRTKRHAGDLGNIVANQHGVATIRMIDPLTHTSGKHNIIGRSLMIHADPDDLGQGGHDDSHTTGHAGKRIACAVIGLARPPKGC